MTNPNLSKRERQIMNIIYQAGQASVSDVLQQLDDPPSYSAVRALIGILEEKGHLTHKKIGRKYIYLPTVNRNKAKKSALKDVVQTFFGGSAQEVVASLLEIKKKDLNEEELERIAQLIDEASEKGEEK